MIAGGCESSIDSLSIAGFSKYFFFFLMLIKIKMVNEFKFIE